MNADWTPGWLPEFSEYYSTGHYFSESSGVVRRKRDPEEKKRKPAPLGDVVTGFLKQAGLDERVDQAAVIPEWESLVGLQIAKVTEPRFVTSDGTLFVAVTTNGWMTELSLMEPQLLRALNASAGRAKIRKIRLQLMR